MLSISWKGSDLTVMNTTESTEKVIMREKNNFSSEIF